MPKFPEPPPAEDLATIAPEIRQLPVSSEIWRLYLRGGRHPTLWSSFRAFGPTHARFDHHLLPACVQERKVLYGAERGPTCLVEVFQDTRIIDRTARNPWLVGFATVRSLPLLDLTGPWPTRAGASMAMATGPRSRARRWARAIYHAYPELEGVFYPSSMAANRPAVALFERAEPSLPQAPFFHRPLADPALLSVLKKVAPAP